METIKPNELKELLKKDITLLDVRRNADYEADKTMIEGAKKVDPERIDEWINSIEKGKEVALYCIRGGSVSKSVTEKLNNAGIKARYIEGGYEALKKDMQ